MPQAPGRRSPSLLQGPAGLADMMAAALRGTTKQALGFPGDMEHIARAIAGNTNPTVMPTSEDMDRHLPPMTTLSDSTPKSWEPTQDLGGFMPVNYLAPVSKAASMVRALRGTPAAAGAAAPAAAANAAAPMDVGRREAMKKIGIAGGAAAVAPGLLVKALKASAPEVKVAEAATGRLGAQTAVRAAAKWSSESMAPIIQRIAQLQSGEAGIKAAHLSPDTLAAAERLFGSPEKLKNADGWMEHWEEIYPPKGATKEALDALSPEDLHKIITEYPPGQVPKHLADAGVTPEMLAYNSMPIRGMGGGAGSPIEQLAEGMSPDLGLYATPPKEFAGLPWNDPKNMAYDKAMREARKAAPPDVDPLEYSHRIGLEDKVMRQLGYR